jgi:hypothetical protein
MGKKRARATTGKCSKIPQIRENSAINPIVPGTPAFARISRRKKKLHRGIKTQRPEISIRFLVFSLS